MYDLNAATADWESLHVLHQLQRPLPLPALLTGTDSCFVCDGIGRNALGLHVLHQLQHPLLLCVWGEGG